MINSPSYSETGSASSDDTHVLFGQTKDSSGNIAAVESDESEHLVGFLEIDAEVGA